MPTAETEQLAVIEEPIRSDGEIPLANILPAARDFPEESWQTIENVPVFAEHSTKTRSGRELSFGRKELQQVAHNCNQRIRSTGDYAGIVIGHTPDPEAGVPDTPLPLIGLAGPFRMGLIRQDGAAAQWAILADFHIHRDQVDAIRRYPRRSAELWVEDDYEDMHLDPIALLGAEAPRLDMGLLYSAVCGNGQEIEKYSACAPSATSVFVPSDETRKDYSAVAPGSASITPGNERNDMAFSPEEIQQIVEAVGQTDWAQWCQSQMQATAAPEVNPAAVPEQLSATPPIPPAPGPPTAPPEMAGLPPEMPPGEEPLPIKYSRLATELDTVRGTVDTLREQLEAERSKRINTERYSALSERRRSRLFDLPAEFDRVKYGLMSDEQFVTHLGVIDTNYREIPLGVSLPTFDGPGALSPDRPGGSATKEKYSKDVSDKALEICKRKAMRGELVDYQEVLEQVASGPAE